MQVFLLLLGAVGALSLPFDDEGIFNTNTCGYESCHKPKPGMLNVHIVPHTHDDVGWLKTVDQYYYGSRNNIQKAGVQYILDSVIRELWEDQKRRFIYVETAFFWKWWVRQPVKVQAAVRDLVSQGRLQFVGGAWSMNDEAAAHYHSTIDQFTWGLSKLNKTFGACGVPRVGWQIDPFGHSREFASLLAMMGYDGLFLGRIDYQDKVNRLKQKTMEMVWRGDDTLGKSSDIFTGVLHNTYSPPPGFCFDVLCNDEPIVDDPESPIYNVESKIATFVELCANYAKSYRTNNILITMGEDFNYQDAGMWFNNLDKLIDYTNIKSAKEQLNITLFYSTPDCYLKAIKDANPQLPLKKDDFFPYASDPTAFWTGYFTSRPTTKYFERESNNYLQMVKQLQVLADLDKHNEFVLNELKSAMGVMQHHDAITGTEKQHVTHDYERLLNQAVDDAMIITKQALNKITQKDANKPPLFDFKRCHLNESRCDISENNDKFIVTIYNPLAWTVKEPIRIPVTDANYQVFGPDGKEIETQAIKIAKAVTDIPTRISTATKELLFITEIKALTYKSFYIKKSTKTKRSNHFEYFTNINEYFDSIKDNFETEKDNFETEKDILKPIEPIVLPTVEYKSINLDVLKDASNFKELDSLDKFLKGYKHDAKVSRMRVQYPKMNEDEMRMLADEPRTVERFDDEVSFENQYFKLDANKATGEIQQISFPDGSRLNLTINMYYYPGCPGRNSGPSDRASGAYIFRPNATVPTKLTIVKTEVANGDLATEFRSYLNPNGYLNTKIYKNLDFVENEFVVGPIPIHDGVGKEYIIKYETNIVNNGEFYTDSNGRQMIKRKLNYRPDWNVTLAEPIAGNYYPVTNEISIQNDDVKMTVLTDRSEGGSSIVEGEIELMVHRRLLWDDAFGVGEPLNETAMGSGLVVRGKHRVLIKNVKANTKKHVFQLHMPVHVLFSDATNIKYDEWLKLNNDFSFIDKDLPNGVHLLTLEPFDDRLLIRFENYLDDSEVQVNLGSIFKGLTVKNVKETMLAANIWADDYNKWSWNNDSVEKVDKIEGFVVKLKAKQIRTFVVDYDVKK
ncbi:lysosomal alpha-mannosidase-like isoform X1 [Anticarsia gemmatalis]|uniref:lysosomal alpha-mannosidase-like isoform X1 n=1 Tax=Anticarsia gemmatalis TaxID=129554 RepID=UPI003F77230E